MAYADAALQPVSWVPLDAIGKMYIDLLFRDAQLPQLVNVVHPRPTSWSEILNGLSSELGNLPIIPLTEWVGRLEARSTHAGAHDIDDVVRRMMQNILYELD